MTLCRLKGLELNSVGLRVKGDYCRVSRSYGDVGLRCSFGRGSGLGSGGLGLEFRGSGLGIRGFECVWKSNDSATQAPIMPLLEKAYEL